MSLQGFTTRYICPHEKCKKFILFDWIGSKIILSLCSSCQKIPEFKDLLLHNAKKLD